MPSDQTTRIPAVPVRTPMFEGFNNALTRTWIIFFERLAGLRGLASGGDIIRHIALGINGELGVGVVPRDVEITPGAGNVFRCQAALINAETPATGGPIKVDFQYCDDAYDVPKGSRTWKNIFETDTGDLDLLADHLQRETGLEQFSGDPAPLDLPHRALVRIRVMLVGSTTPGSNLGVQIIGEIRKAA